MEDAVVVLLRLPALEDHHGAGWALAVAVGIVVYLDPVRRLREVEHPPEGIGEVHCCLHLVKVLHGEPDHVPGAAVGRPVHPDLPFLLLLQILLEIGLVLDLLGKDDLVGDGPRVVVLEEEGGEGVAEVRPRGLLEEPFGDEHAPSEAQEDHLYPGLLREKSPHVPVYAHVLVHVLLLHEALYGEVFLFLGAGLLEVPRLRRLFDLLFELLQELLVPSREEVGDLIDDRPVRLFIDLIHAGGRALVDAGQDARPRPRPEDGIPASPHGIDGLHHLEKLFRVLGAGVGPEVEGAVVLDISRYGEGGEAVLDAQAQGDIRLVVLEHDVVLGLVLLDEVVLEEKGLLLVAREHDGDVVHVAQEALGLLVLVPLSEIAFYPVLDASRLAYIDDVLPFVTEEIDAGALREVRYIIFGDHRKEGRIIWPAPSARA